MGGELKLESEFGKGSKFSFELSLPVVESASDVTKNSNSILQQYEHCMTETINILIVEDNAINQLIAKEMLSKEGFKVTVVNNGQEAIDTVKNHVFDLVLMDIQMPVMDGKTATRYLKSDPEYKHIPIIAMTANVMTHEVDNYFKIGFSGFISKPFVSDEILKVVFEILSQPSLVNH